MTNQYDILENQAHRQAGITPGTNRSEINNKQRSIIDNFIRDGVRRNPERYANDPRASKYLKDTSYKNFQNLPQKETNNYQQDEEPLNDYDESSLPPEEQAAQDVNEEPNDDEDNEELPDDNEDNLLNKEKNQQKNSDSANNNINKEENLGKNAAEKSGANVAEKGATTAAESGSTAAATDGAIAAEEGAALAAEGAAAAAEATAMAAEGAAVAAEGAVVGWPLLVGIIIALILFFIILFFLQNMAIAYPGSTDTGSGSTGTTNEDTRQKIIEVAKKELDSKVCGTGSQNNEGEPQKYVRYTCGLKDSDAAWCAGFAGWVYGHASIDYPRTCAANTMMDGLKYRYLLSSGKIPKIGDMIQRDHHIGIVYKIEGTKLYTIEGNAAPCVKVVEYSNYGRGSWLRFGNSFEKE